MSITPAAQEGASMNSDTLPAGQTMQLRFDASLPTVEGILAMVQEWCAEQAIPRDDALSLRLVLEELLTNICMHGQLPRHNKVDLLLEVTRPQAGERRAPPRSGQGLARITLRDAGARFNPLEHAAGPRRDPEAPAATGSR